MTQQEDPSARMLAGTVAVCIPHSEARTRTWTDQDGRTVLGFEQACMTRHREGGHTVVTVKGELAVYETPTFRDRLKLLVDSEDGHLILDLNGVELLDSTALGALVSIVKRLRDRSGVRTLHLVAEENGLLHRTLRITGLTKVFGFSHSVTDAMTAVALPAPPRTGDQPPALLQ